MTAFNNSPDMLLDDFPAPVFLLGFERPVIKWVNQAGQEWLGRSARNILTKDLTDIIQNPDACIDAHGRVSQTEAPISLRDFMVKRDGYADQRCHLMVFPSVEGVGLFVMPASVQPSQAPSHSDSLSSMGRMLAHEIKNPLAGINGAAQLLRDDVKTGEGQSLIDLIGSEIDRIRRLAERMERLGDTDPKNRDVVNIHEILRKARRVIQAASADDDDDIVFSERYDPSLPEALGDADTLMQALLNLIKNAHEAISKSEQGGEIRLETAFRSGVRAVNGQNGSGKVLPIEICVIDDGPGISDSIRQDIFQPFVTNKPQGQGLGLALVAKVAKAHGGLVEVQSRPGRTVFSILLPKPLET